MRRYIFCLLALLFISTVSFPQSVSHIDVDAGILRNHQGFFRPYDGIIDLGVGYHIPFANHLFGGASFHIGFLNYQNTPARSVIYKPKLNLGYEISIGERIGLVPSIQAGCAFVSIANKEYNYNEVQSGLNASCELRVRWITNIMTDYYVFGRYDYIILDKDAEFTQLEYFRRINLFALGFGLIIKSGDYE